MKLAAGSNLVTTLSKNLTGENVPPFEVFLPDGRSHQLGRPGDPPAFQVRLRSQRAVGALVSLDEAAIGLAFIDGEIDVEGDFLTVLDLRASLSDRHPLRWLGRFARPLLTGQSKSNQRWVPTHYDHGNDFYFAFLDKRHRLYSQALYTDDKESLEQAAENKLNYIVEACQLGPGSRVLDIGGGWGSFGRFAAARGIDVTMLTISHEQFKFLTGLAEHSDLPGTLRAVYSDVFQYAPDEQYDAVTMLGVMEHIPDYPRIFAKFVEFTRPGGRVYLDFSANRSKYQVSAFTYQHLFPGNHTPVILPDLLAAMNGTDFEPIALHNDRHSYYLTLQAWAVNLQAARAEVVERHGERTFRLFQLYLWAGAHQMHRDGRLESFRTVFQRSYGSSSAGVGTYRPL